MSASDAARALAEELAALEERVASNSASIASVSTDLSQFKEHDHVHTHGQYAPAGHTHETTPEPPPEPPPPPSGVEVPPGPGARQWVIDRYNAGERIFRWSSPHDAPLPCPPEIQHYGNGETRQSVVKMATPTGEDIWSLRFDRPETYARLTRSGDGPILEALGNLPHGVKVGGFEVTGVSTSGLQQGVIDGELFDGLTVMGMHVFENEGTAFRTGKDCHYEGNFVHHNEHLGIGGVHRGGAPKILRNDVGHNSQAAGGELWEDGNMKLVHGHAQETHGLVSLNYVHDSTYGIWTDIDPGWEVRENGVENNQICGIFGPEAGQRPIHHPYRVHGNIVRNNGWRDHPNIWEVMEGNIVVADSRWVEVLNNDVHMVSSREYGITAKQQKRSDHYNRVGAWLYVDELTIKGNRVYRHSGNNRPHVGLYDDTGYYANKPVDRGFIPLYLANRNNLSVPSDRRATMIDTDDNIRENV